MELWTWQREAAREDNPRFTSMESCESEETEEESFRAPPGLDGLMRDGLMAYSRPLPELPEPPTRS